jgi:hypothetical protein
MASPSPAVGRAMSTKLQGQSVDTAITDAEERTLSRNDSISLNWVLVGGRDGKRREREQRESCKERAPHYSDVAFVDLSWFVVANVFCRWKWNQRRSRSRSRGLLVALSLLAQKIERVCYVRCIPTTGEYVSIPKES